MKITKVESRIVSLLTSNCIFTRIETDVGISGDSETVMKRRPKTVKAYIDELGLSLIGRDPLAIEDFVEKAYRDSFWVGGPLHSTGISAIEIALWDILGKDLNVPIYRLLGGPARTEVRVYCHCRAGSTPQEFARNAKACVKRGYTALKTTLPMFYGSADVIYSGADTLNSAGYSGTKGAIAPSHKETELLPTSVFEKIATFFQAAREAVGPDVEIGVDCHGRLSPANAIRLCAELEPHNLLFVEEPVPPENPAWLAAVKENTTIPIAAGERWATIYGANPYLVGPAVDVAQPDVVNCGGFSQAKKIAAIAEANLVSIAPHNPNGPLATAASLQLAFSIPNFLILESIGSEESFAAWQEIVTNPPEVVDGYLHLPTTPGLGTSVRNEVFDSPEDRYRLFSGWR
jgi:galactonate dehydratase